MKLSTGESVSGGVRYHFDYEHWCPPTITTSVRMHATYLLIIGVLGLSVVLTQSPVYASDEEEVVEAEDASDQEGAEPPDTPGVAGEKPPAESESPSEQADVPDGNQKRIIGATARIQEAQSGFIFLARVDTGAKSCSLHVDELRIDDEAEDMAQNVGKKVMFTVTDENGKTHVCSAKVKQVVSIKNPNGKERRYKVPLELIWKNKKKKVLVTLNNRTHMSYPLLIGRNFLKGDFLVDVEVNDTD